MEWFKAQISAEWIKDWWGVFIGVGAIVLGALRYLFVHGKKHKEIDMRLDDHDEELSEGGVLFKENQREHREIMESLVRTETNVAWLVEKSKEES